MKTYIVICRDSDRIGLKQSFNVKYIYYGDVYNGQSVSMKIGPKHEDFNAIKTIFEESRGIASPNQKITPVRKMKRRRKK